MNCPSCKIPLVTFELESLEVDYCFECKGIWLDKGELEILACLDEKGPAETLLSKTKTTGEDIKKCPICVKRMQKACFDDSGCFVDICGKGHGIWFDKGELKRIISCLSGNEENRAAVILDGIFKSDL